MHSIVGSAARMRPLEFSTDSPLHTTSQHTARQSDASNLVDVAAHWEPAHALSSGVFAAQFREGLHNESMSEKKHSRSRVPLALCIMSHPQRIYGCGQDRRSTGLPFYNPRITTSSYAAGEPYPIPVVPAYEYGQAVYNSHEIGQGGRLVINKYYVCCAEIRDGIMCYRLKDQPPPSANFVTGWIREGSLRRWRAQ
ncbi:hypothetical protein ABVK25_009472 [Lepraria finkii]|uniref:Uncharacterized protein n=1 Tax=Lepraria finkii TaxID=1340010 RepID=A0ABR4AXP3_9LECA